MKEVALRDSDKTAVLFIMESYLGPSPDSHSTSVLIQDIISDRSTIESS